MPNNAVRGVACVASLVVIPQTQITFEYVGVSDDDREAFATYFDLRFMKGLG